MSVPVRGESGDLPGAMLCPLSALAGPVESTPRSRASARMGLSSLKICWKQQSGEEGRGGGVRGEEGAGQYVGREGRRGRRTHTINPSDTEMKR